jgi:hypothetical protein
MFANDNNLFMKHFEAAFRKMTMLGVDASLLVGALPCSAGCAGAPIKPMLTAEAETIVLDTVHKAVEEADIQLEVTAEFRAPEIEELITEVVNHDA